MPKMKLFPLCFLAGWFLFGFWSGVGFSILVTICQFLLIWAYRLAKYWPMSIDGRDPVQFRRPVLCRREVNGRIGFVLQKDLRAASDLWWLRLYRRDEDTFFDPGHSLWNLGHLCRVETVFVFPRESEHSDKLTRMYFTERADFEVPITYSDGPAEFEERFVAAVKYFDSFGTVQFK